MSTLATVTRPWSKIPAWICQRDNIAQLFGGGNKAGRSIAMLRLIIWVAMSARRHGDYTLECPLWQLASSMKISLPTLRAAILEAVRLGIVNFRRGGGRSSSKIELLFPQREPGKIDAFFIIPHDPVQSRIDLLGKRGEISLAAHKIYLLLLARRPNTEREVFIKYDKLRDSTGIQRENIRSALSLLAANGLVDVNKETITSGGGVQNSYRIRGELGRIVASEGKLTKPSEGSSIASVRLPNLAHR